MVEVTDLERFPPTVVGHTEQSEEPSGVTLELLDSGTRQDPRVIEVYDGEQEADFYL